MVLKKLLNKTNNSIVEIRTRYENSKEIEESKELFLKAIKCAKDKNPDEMLEHLFDIIIRFRNVKPDYYLTNFAEYATGFQSNSKNQDARRNTYMLKNFIQYGNLMLDNFGALYGYNSSSDIKKQEK